MKDSVSRTFQLPGMEMTTPLPRKNTARRGFLRRMARQVERARIELQFADPRPDGKKGLEPGELLPKRREVYADFRRGDAWWKQFAAHLKAWREGRDPWAARRNGWFP